MQDTVQTCAPPPGAASFRQKWHARTGAIVAGLAARRQLIYNAAGICLVLFVAAFVLEHGHFNRTEEFRGPFAADPTGTLQYGVAIGTDIPFLAIAGPAPRSLRPPGELSPVQLRINRELWEPPQHSEPSLEQGKFLGIRGLYRTLRFNLPSGVANDSTTLLQVRYEVRPHGTLYSFIANLTGFLVLLAIALAARCGDAWLHRWALAAGRLLRFTMRLATWLLVTGCLLYCGTIAYGFATGDALPTATVLREFPHASLLTRIRLFAPYSVLAFAMVGAAASWLSFLTCQSDAFALQQAWLWKRCGLPVLLCLFLYCASAGGWSGHFDPIDPNYMSIAGLVPHSDAAGYFKDTFHLAWFGSWELMGSRRPMGEALRELTTVAAGYSYVTSLIIQLALMTVTLYAASCVIATQYGLWAGVAFAGFGFIIGRAFLTTTLTEPLGYILGLIGLMFFIQSTRQHSLPHALLGLAALTTALLMRMGALLTIPFLVAWIGFAFGKRIRARAQAIGLACAVVFMVLGVNFALQRLYGAQGVGTGENISWTICGLTVGADWGGCSKIYGAALSALPNEHAQSIYLFARAWENLLAHPALFAGELWDNLAQFVWGLWPFMLTGYGSFYLFSSESYLVLLLMLAAVFYCLRNSSATERSFWIAMLASLPLSAALIMKADGWRLLTVTNLFVAAFLALAFAAPDIARRNKQPSSPRWQGAAIALGATMILFVVFPALAHALAQRELRAHPPVPVPGPHEEIVTGGRRMSGFLVVSDGSSGPRSVPVMQVSEFARMVKAIHLEDDFGPFLDEVLPRARFAFVGAGRMDGPNNTNIYIVPPEVLERRDVWAWRFTTRAGVEKPWSILRDVVAAEPLP